MDPPDLYFSKISNFQNKCYIGKRYWIKILRNIEIKTKSIEFRNDRSLPCKQPDDNKFQNTWTKIYVEFLTRNRLPDYSNEGWT